MELNNMASESASQSQSGLNNSAPLCVVPSLSLPDMDLESNAYNSLALQQYQFEQLLVNQLTLTQQQADSLAERTKAAAERSAASAAEISTLLKDEKINVLEVNYVEQQVEALAISIQAAAERAAAHAADISRLLNDGNCDVPKVKNVELKPKREEPELKPHSRTPSSPTSLISKSISPLRPRPITPNKPRNGVREDYSQRDRRSQSHRRRHVDRAIDRDSHDRYTSSISRRSPSARKRSTRHRHDDSFSPQRSRSRSRSPTRRHRKPSRVHDDSRFPQRSRSRSRSPRLRHRKPSRVQDTHDISGRTLSPTPSTRSVLMHESKVNNNANNKADNTTLNLDVNCREVEDKPSRKSLWSRLSYPSRSHSTTDNSGKLSTHVNVPGHPRDSGDSRTYPSPESVKPMNDRKADSSSLVMVLDGAEEIEEGELIQSPKP
ncbi:hypothetical protein MKW94_004467 [Papaver nudicaule]|uniref:Uncharacterized protein n=1 Tax=Papaver nudicaule TaxID=74823 RepID=A0AA41SD22_PAPNU|nr:hypothetical protein [Papaver nudicaule]